jgi:tRNA U34 2-thiouridine synthase MnmA/TrmU
VRYRARPVPATIMSMDEAGLGLALTTPVRAITPGQSGVLYAPDRQVLGGGVIT